MAELAFPGSILPYEIVRDTLVIIPKGDIVGFAPHMFHRELETLRKLIRKNPHLKNLVIDLQGANYFSPDMLELLNELGQTMQGQVVICSPSDDVRIALQKLDIPHLPGIYTSAASALSGVTGSAMSGTFYAVRTRSRTLYRAMFGLLGVMLLGGSLWLLMLLLQSPQDQRDYRRLLDLANQLSQLRQSSPRSVELNDFISRTREEVTGIAHRHREARPDPIAEQLLMASSELLRDMGRRASTAGISPEFEAAMRELERLFEADGRPVTTRRR